MAKYLIKLSAVDTSKNYSMKSKLWRTVLKGHEENKDCTGLEVGVLLVTFRQLRRNNKIMFLSA